jgi:hypothetical protein
VYLPQVVETKVKTLTEGVMPIIKWHGHISGAGLNPTWEVKRVRIHSLRNWKPLGSDTTPRDVTLLVIEFTMDQWRKLLDNYSVYSFPDVKITPTYIVEIRPHAVLWSWDVGPEYRSRAPTQQYTAFDVIDDE